jgi:hypothetical protein
MKLYVREMKGAVAIVTNRQHHVPRLSPGLDSNIALWALRPHENSDDASHQHPENPAACYRGMHSAERLEIIATP